MKSPSLRTLLPLTAGAALALVAAEVAPEATSEVAPEATENPATAHSRFSDSLHVENSPPMRSGPLGGYAEVVAQASPSVVSITSSAYVPVSRDLRTGEIIAREIPGGLGSGVIVSGDGYVLTNVHVISQGDRVMDRVYVTLSDDRQFEAEVIGVDPESDIAVLDLEADDLPVAVLGDSDQLLPGDTVLAIGSPFGLSETVTSGIVSAVGRTDVGIGGQILDEEFIQTDASINPGNSGGALVDNHGRVVGINTAIFSRSGGNIGIGFAIPISKAIEVAGELVDDGRVSRGFLGILPEAMSEDLARAAAREGLDLPEEGILVWRLESGTPAELGGLRRHDVITAIDGEPVNEKRDFLRRIARLKPETEVVLAVARNGHELELEVTLGNRPAARLR